MRMNSILATTAVVLGLGIGPALAAGPLPAEATGASFAALSGVTAEAMSAAEMAAVEGRALRVSSTSLGGGFTTLSTNSTSRFNLGGGLSVPHPVFASPTSNPPGRFTGWCLPCI